MLTLNDYLRDSDETPRSMTGGSTMTIIKTWDNGANYGDFDRWEITLIRRKRYHLICEGGPRTAFVEKCGENQWCAGKVEIMLKLEEAKKIKEMGADEVYDWAKEALLEAENWH